MTTAQAPSATSTDSRTPYENLISLVREAALLHSTSSLLHWDQQAIMPAQGLAHRSDQLAQLARLHHAMATDPRIGSLLAGCEDDASLMADAAAPPAVNVREIRRSYDRLTKLPGSLVEEIAKTASLGQHVWAEARRDSDFARFLPYLEKNVQLSRRKAECFGWADGGEPWDALAEDYEPGCTAADVQKVFGPLRDRLHALLTDLMSAAHKPSDEFNRQVLPIAQQEAFVRWVSVQLGFDYTRGRLDRSTHPFCGGTHCNDVRLTTRYRDDFLLDALGSTAHESGHGIYEQGLLYEHVGTPMGNSVSLGIHESQSRMWENQVCRSRSFWKFCYPKMREFFSDAMDAYPFDDIYGAANIVEPGFIRVEADEATYNMHIMIRFEIERALMSGDLAPADIPEVWNARYKEYLGLDVPDDRRGCLQDIHWSMASIGYFPTYTLGNLYAAQLFDKAAEELGDLDTQFERGEFGALKTWLNTKIHQQGMRYRAAELCVQVTGKPLSADYLLSHLDSKLRPLYGI